MRNRGKEVGRNQIIKDLEDGRLSGSYLSGRQMETNDTRGTEE